MNETSWSMWLLCAASALSSSAVEVAEGRHLICEQIALCHLILVLSEQPMTNKAGEAM